MYPPNTHMIHEMPTFEKADRYRRKSDGKIFLGVSAPHHFEIVCSDFDCAKCAGTGGPCTGECKGAGVTVDANGENKKCKDCNGDAMTCEVCDGRGIVAEGGRIEGLKGDMILFDQEAKHFFVSQLQDHMPGGRMEFCNPPRFIFANEFEQVVEQVKG